MPAVAVKARPPAAAAPITMLMAPISLSAWINSRPTSNIRVDMYSKRVVWGVMG